MFKKIILFALCIVFISSCVNRNYEEGLTVTKFENGIIHTADNRQIVLRPEGYEDATVIALIRHTEALSDEENPGLTEEGIARAEKLAALLLPLDIQEVYMTGLKRTIFTARPLAMPNNIRVFTYDPDQYDKVTTRILENFKGQNLAIYGHSNTTPELVNILIDENKFEQIPHEEYDNLFLVLHNGSTSEDKTDALVYKFKY